MYPWKGLEKKFQWHTTHPKNSTLQSRKIKIKICSCFGIVFVNVETIDWCTLKLFKSWNTRDFQEIVIYTLHKEISSIVVEVYFYIECHEQNKYSEMHELNNCRGHGLDSVNCVYYIILTLGRDWKRQYTEIIGYEGLMGCREDWKICWRRNW
jgi:hypothetical protein